MARRVFYFVLIRDGSEIGRFVGTSLCDVSPAPFDRWRISVKSTYCTPEEKVCNIAKRCPYIHYRDPQDVCYPHNLLYRPVESLVRERAKGIKKGKPAGYAIVTCRLSKENVISVRNETRTHTAFLPLPPQSSASTNSAIRTTNQFFKTVGAKNGTRTRDPNLGKVVLYQLSYFRISDGPGRPLSLRDFVGRFPFLRCKVSTFFCSVQELNAKKLNFYVFVSLNILIVTR